MAKGIIHHAIKRRGGLSMMTSRATGGGRGLIRVEDVSGAPIATVSVVIGLTQGRICLGGQSVEKVPTEAERSSCEN